MRTTETIRRILSGTATIGGAFALIALAGGAPSVALGFVIGTGLGLFSLWSLAVAIPRLCSGHDPASRFWLGMLLIAKLPIYAGVLTFAMASPKVSAFAVFAGVALLPMVIIGQNLGRALRDLGMSGHIPGAHTH